VIELIAYLEEVP